MKTTITMITTKNGYQMHATKVDAQHVLVQDSNLQRNVIALAKWMTWVEHHRANGAEVM